MFEESLEDALCVFKTGGANSDIVEENQKIVLFYIDLDNEEFVAKNSKKEEQNPDSENEGKLHPVLLNQYPLCKRDSLFLLFAEEGLPQVLSDELLIELL